MDLFFIDDSCKDKTVIRYNMNIATGPFYRYLYKPSGSRKNVSKYNRYYPSPR
jgi:hypothetical protein